MADYAKLYDDFRKARTEVAAISVDPPERSAGLRKDLGIQFPILSDSDRATITEWGLLNANEKGGIAIPTTFLIDYGRKVRAAKVEEMMTRIEPRAMLNIVRSIPGPNLSMPRARGVNPAAMFLRAMANGFRFGVKVKPKF